MFLIVSEVFLFQADININLKATWPKCSYNASDNYICAFRLIKSSISKISCCGTILQIIKKN